VRQMFQGKTAADVTFAGAAPWFRIVSVRSISRGFARGASFWKSAGEFDNRVVERGADSHESRSISSKKQNPPWNLTQAPLIVAIRARHQSSENIPQAEALAKALGGEIAASRPICDEGWLRWSGRSAVPARRSRKIVFSVGISGAIQHVVA